MKKIYDLFDFDEVEIKTRTDSYDHVYTATLKKHMTFEMFDEREYLPTKEEWIEKAKETFVKKIICNDFLQKCDEDDIEYFTDLKNAIESTGLVDQFLWDRGYKRIGSTWKPQSMSKKESRMKTITIDGQEYQLTPITQEKKLVVKREFSFEIHPDELGKMTWHKAVEKVKELGDGWRLPTITELQLIWDSEHKDLFKKEWYWSSSEGYSGYAWGFFFYDGYADLTNKYHDYYVRAVRALTI